MAKEREREAKKNSDRNKRAERDGPYFIISLGPAVVVPAKCV
jgi:hypothetical protein